MVQDLLHRLQGVKRQGSGWQAKCPAHEDRKASLSLAEGKSGGIVLHCHAGCATENVVEAMGLTMADLAPEQRNIVTRKPEIVKCYDYTDENGNLLFQACRMVPKDFRQRRPDGRGGWIWNLQGVRLVPYRLPELLEAVACDKQVFIVEGEKDVDALASRGLPATCNPMGAGKWKPEFSVWFQQARVVILPDNDEPGQKHAESIEQSLAGTARSVARLNLPGLPPKGDVSDWFDNGGTVDELLKLVAKVSDPSSGDKWQPCDLSRWFQEEPPEVDWLFKDRIARGDVGLLIAVGGTGKTMLCQELAVSAACGRPLLQTFQPVKAMKVLFLAGEDNEIVLWTRMKRIVEAYAISDYQKANVVQNLRIYAGKSEPLLICVQGVPMRTARYRWLQEQVAEFEPDLLILDPKARFDGTEENVASHATAFVVAVEEIMKGRGTALITHHIVKARAGELSSDAARGSGALRDACRWAYTMTPLSDADASKFGILEDKRNYVVADSTKSNYCASLPKPLYLKRDEGGVLHEVNLLKDRFGTIAELLARWLAENEISLRRRNLERNEGEEAKRLTAHIKGAMGSTRVRNEDIEQAVKYGLSEGLLVSIRDENSGEYVKAHSRVYRSKARSESVLGEAVNEAPF
jgi:hypothetical protein